MNIYEVKCVFENELSVMKKDGFIDGETYEKVSTASNLFYKTKFEQIKQKEKSIKQEQQRIHAEKIIERTENRQERKASALLNLGVIFLFLAGLIFSTTNWSRLGLGGKVIAVIFMGSILTAGSYVAENKLSLKKTGFSLWVLTTLYIPIVGITFMYSLVWNIGINIDDPKSLLGLACISLISSGVNLFSAKKYKNKFYIWASLAALQLFILCFFGSFGFKIEEILLLCVICNMVVMYGYEKIQKATLKKYIGQYILVLNGLTILFSLIVGLIVTNNLPYILASTLIFPILIVTSRTTKDMITGIISILYLAGKTIEFCARYELDIWVFAIPALVLFAIFYFNNVLKLHKTVKYTAYVTSFIMLSIGILSDTPMALIAAVAMVATLILVYKKKMFSLNKIGFSKKVYEMLIPFYTYVLLVRIPFIFIETYNDLQFILFFCIPAIIITCIQFVIPAKEKNLALVFSKVSIVLITINGLISINKIEVTVLMLLVLTSIEIIGLYKKLNKIAYLFNLIMSSIIFIRIFQDFNYKIVGVSLVLLVGLFVILMKLDSKNKKFISLIAGIFLMISTMVVYDNLPLVLIIFILIIPIAIVTFKNEDNISLLLYLLILGVDLLFLSKALAETNTFDRNLTFILITESLYVMVLAILSSKFYNKIVTNKSFDSFIITSFVISVITAFSSFGAYVNVFVTTIAVIVIILLNYRKLKDSVLLKSVLVLRLLLAYMQVVLLLELSIGDGILIIPILSWAVLSKYWILDKSKPIYGDISEKISLIFLNLKLLQNFFNFHMASAMVVITIGIVVLVISYSKKIKVYFITSLVMIGLPLFHSTLEFWQKLPWWSYLLIVGVVLLWLGSMAEKNKKDIKDTGKNFFRNWK